MPGQQGTSQDQMVDPGIDQKLQTRTIGETLGSIAECSAFYELIREADLSYILRRSGLHTLLAPRNDAMQNASPQDFELFLNQHLLPGGVESFDLKRVQNVKTLAGESLPVRPENGSFRIANARIVRSDIACTNGVIHVIDAVLSM
jgi:uncharacterized surface protein with fasciclin (FAS1) repeats